MEETRRYATRDMDKMSFNVIAVEETTTRRILAKYKNYKCDLCDATGHLKQMCKDVNTRKSKDKNDSPRGESKSKHGKPKTKGKHTLHE